MNELRILFDKSGDNAYSLRLTNDWGGNAGELLPFKLFLDEDDFENLRWYLEDFMDLPDGGSMICAQGIEDDLADWGRRRYRLIFDHADYRELLNHLRRQTPPRLITLATRDPHVLRPPWELMADSRGPLIRQDFTIRRQLETARAPIAVRNHGRSEVRLGTSGVLFPCRRIICDSREKAIDILAQVGMIIALNGVGLESARFRNLRSFVFG
jgi:hypothetical protein